MTKHVVWDPAGGIIIIADPLSNMLGAGMHWNVRGASCWCSEGSWAWFEAFLTRKTFPDKSWRTW